MEYTSVGDIFESIEQARRAVYDRVKGLSAEQAAFRSAQDGWSPCELLEHMCISEERLVAALGRSLGAAEAEGRPIPAAGMPPVSIDRFQEQARGKFQSPQMIQPTGTLSMPEVIERMRQSRDTLSAMRPRLEAIDVSEATFPHPVF